MGGTVTIYIGRYDLIVHGILYTKIGKIGRDKLVRFLRFSDNHDTPICWETDGSINTNFYEHWHNLSYERELKKLRDND